MVSKLMFRDPHFGHAGCWYSPPTSSAVKLAGIAWASTSIADSPSSSRTRNRTPPTALDRNQLRQTILSSARKQSKPSASNLLWAIKASGKSRYRHNVMRSSDIAFDYTKAAIIYPGNSLYAFPETPWCLRSCLPMSSRRQRASPPGTALPEESCSCLHSRLPCSTE
jgi:hypothetical protein